MASKIRIALGIVGGGLGLIVVAAGGFYLWASSAAQAKLDQDWEAHAVDFPVPFPLTDAELVELSAQKDEERRSSLAWSDHGASGRAAAATGVPAPDPFEGVHPLVGVDIEAIELERARARGKHYVEARYGCIGCHGDDFGGGVMMDEPPIAVLKGPNITKGGKIADYTVSDWDLAVRHGILPTKKPSAMPTEDFRGMSDRELSDIIAYIESVPAVERASEPPVLGPMGKILMATGQLTLSAETHPDHLAAHLVEPPAEAPTAEFGQHLLQVCTGCHRPDLAGGPMAFGPPDWPPAGNLTPHEDGLAGWTYEDFVAALREGKRPDGTALKAPMSEMTPFAARMTETELQAMWAHLQSLPPAPTGE